jgi:acetylornithine/succinyldiaminopimelate/putrescine aminotransferase
MSLTQRQLFLNHLAQTSDFPLSLEIEHAEGIYLTDTSGKKYIDLISGISVSNLGHRHPQIINAVKKQLEHYTYLMVYGEYVQSPQVKLATALAELLPEPLSSVYLVNSGSEANEGAMKLAKRYTGRREIISFNKAYHGSTQGCLSIIGDDSFKKSFEPLLPETKRINFNTDEDLLQITEKTACVIVEPIQGEAGINIPTNNFLQKLRKRCNETGTLLIFDEIQTGFGRTGKFFAMEHFNVVPDIVTFAKGMGAGFPIGAFVSSKQIMDSLKTNPILGHITTFGGHPVSAAAALENIRILKEQKNTLIDTVSDKSLKFLNKINHPKIKSKRAFGLMIAIEFDSFETNKKIIDTCINNGVITDWFLFNDKSLRIAPPLIISDNEIETACEIINKSIKHVLG